MDDVTGSGLIADFLFGLGDLFVIINPYGLAFMARLFGEEAPVTKLSAFLLLCMGVQIIVTGVLEVARSLSTTRHAPSSRR
ncbi:MULTISPECIES: hypothetical protein [unclassified Bradyrhizobium]|uniref:hypothetical protein n=1 Tax=unclassified Bradyrhizobium TaxID=2631580 RepID=UPI00037474EE|nr:MULTISPECIES: hypothetical protein [unclassified Bradyrhizobium]MBB4256534.1 small neutral amino acid transporter SnatA (MarC family) [Bradyrhizobium sp. CIR3A]NYG43440.1 small neutral amino acid transporter SnatA (MarC family) [Bradyrhizobium sp. IAR9]